MSLSQQEIIDSIGYMLPALTLIEGQDFMQGLTQNASDELKRTYELAAMRSITYQIRPC
jgi:hypothetical protein